MEQFSLIVDRVDNTNIFNVIKGELPGDDGHHLQSVLDGDLIEEFLGEIERIYRLSNSLRKADDEHRKDGDINLLNMMRTTGETFFEQFFPPIIQQKIRSTNYMHLFFNLDPSLAHIPWELLHDGRSFLGDKFSLGKSIKSSSTLPASSAATKLKMLIIADPTEELEWARREGEELFENLSRTIPSDKLEIEFIGGSQITKLRLLNALKGKDIIHYCGHLHYSKEHPEENGWQLFNRKVLHAREIGKSGAKPKLVFSNSCLSRNIGKQDDILDMDPSSDIASSFLNSGILNYVGTNWEIPDNEKTLDFALKFYEGIFASQSIGVALLKSRTYSRQNFSINDLTWANYTLYGNPVSVVYKEAQTTFNVTSNILKPQIVLGSFPTPIATSYKNFAQTSGKDFEADLKNLFSVFENTMLIFGSIIFANHRHHNLRERPDFESGKELDLGGWIDLIYEALYDLQSLKLPVTAPEMVQTLYVHRDMIYKLNGWLDAYVNGKIKQGTWETYCVTFQYLLENFLMDSYFIKNFQLFYIFPDDSEHLVFSGVQPRKMPLFLPETEDRTLSRKIEDARGNLALLDQNNRSLVRLAPYCEFEFGADGKGSFQYLNYKSFGLSRKD